MPIDKIDFQQIVGFTKAESATVEQYHSAQKADHVVRKVFLATLPFCLLGIVITGSVIALGLAGILGGILGGLGFALIPAPLLIAASVDTFVNPEPTLLQLKYKISPDLIYDHPYGSKPITSPNGDSIGRSVQLPREGCKPLFQTYEFFEMQELRS